MAQQSPTFPQHDVKAPNEPTPISQISESNRPPERYGALDDIEVSKRIDGIEGDEGSASGRLSGTPIRSELKRR